jgi:hypothetical protein
LRTSGSIYQFEAKALKTWNIKKAAGKNDLDGNKVFLGLYHLNDWRGFVAHRGRRFVLWAGGDLLNLERGYAFSDGVDLEKSKRWSFVPWHWIFRIFKAEHYCENEVEFERLKSLGIKAKIIPSFLEDVKNFDICFKPSSRPHVYISAREGNAEAYGESLIERIAQKVPEVTFHFYGIARPSHDNIIYHGNVSAEQFNQDIKNYQGCIRANESDGCSELVAKASLMGQYAISRIQYDNIWHYRTDGELISNLRLLSTMTEPNLRSREWVLKNVNRYPWNNSAIQ